MIHHRRADAPSQRSIATATTADRHTRTARWLLMAAGGAHATTTLVFAAIAQYWLAIASALTVVFLVVLYRMLRHGRIGRVALLGFLEALAHISLWSFALGYSSNAHHYLLLLALIAAFAADSLPTLAQRLLSGSSAFLWLVFGLLQTPAIGLVHPPPSPEALHRLGALNLVAMAVMSVGLAETVTDVFLVAERKLAEANRLTRNLLFETLPRPIAERLLARRGTLATRHEAVTVLFVDLVGFTPLSSSRSPEAVVQLLDDWFQRLDALAAAHGVEKIKTIGDAWMGVAGVPEPTVDHADRAVALAGAMLRELTALRKQHGEGLSVRIGVHSGAVIAGVLGHRRPQYDVWGDTVNTASRLESQGVPGHAQVSAATLQVLTTPVALVPRGEVELRGKGKVEAWLGTGDTIPARPQVRT